MSNSRVFYACQRVGIAPIGSTNFTSVRGLQSVGMTTTFNLTQAFELGQIELYDNVEGIPDVEMTMSKVLDGYAPLYTLLTQNCTALNASTTPTLVGRSAARANVALAIYPDTGTNVAGPAVSTVLLSGLYVSAVSYGGNVTDTFKENVTCVGNNKVWVGVGSVTWDTTNPFANNNDVPYSINGSGGVQMRQAVLMGSTGSIFPLDIPGLDTSGHNIWGTNGYNTHLQSFTTSVNLGREELFELGHKATYCRYVRFPVQVTSAFSMVSVSGDMVSASEDGLIANGCSNYNLKYQQIILKMCEGLRVDLGNRNKLKSVNMTGGDTSGGNQELTYNYENWNDFTVLHPQDPNASFEAFQPSGSQI